MMEKRKPALQLSKIQLENSDKEIHHKERLFSTHATYQEMRSETTTPRSLVPLIMTTIQQLATTSNVRYIFLKRTLDIFLALTGLLVMLPVFFIIALCIKINDGGEILYFREVLGQHGKRFYAFKFRTMIRDAEEYLEQRPQLKQRYLQNMKLLDDPRITRVGRFLRKASLDEFPQLVNVLLGQMSLVGPRIIHPSELERYGDYAEKRLSVKPGITGLWQISGRQHISYAERVQLDMRYIDTMTLIGDCVILLKTLAVVIFHPGA